MSPTTKSVLSPQCKCSTQQHDGGHPVWGRGGTPFCSTPKVVGYSEPMAGRVWGVEGAVPEPEVGGDQAENWVGRGSPRGPSEFAGGALCRDRI